MFLWNNHWLQKLVFLFVFCFVFFPTTMLGRQQAYQEIVWFKNYKITAANTKIQKERIMGPGWWDTTFWQKIIGTDKAQLANKMVEVGTWHRINGMCWRLLDPYDKVMKRKTYGWSSAWTSSGASMPDKHIMCQMNWRVQNTEKNISKGGTHCTAERTWHKRRVDQQ